MTNPLTSSMTLFDKHVWTTFFNPGEVAEVRIVKVYGKSEAWGGGLPKALFRVILMITEIFARRFKKPINSLTKGFISPSKLSTPG